METPLKLRQAKVVRNIEKMYGINLKENHQKKEVNKMTTKQDVVTKAKRKATIVTPEVDLGPVRNQALEFLNEMMSTKDFSQVESQLEETKIGYYFLKHDKRLLLGVKYLVHPSGQTEYFLVVPENLKNFSESLHGTYQENNWLGQFPIDGNVKKFSPIIESIVEKFKAKPVAKKAPVVKPVAKKKNKPVVKHI